MPRLAARPFASAALVLLLLLGRTVSAAPLLTGTFTVGPGGTYATLTAAIAAVTTQGLSGAVVLELVPAYTSAGETFPLVIGAIAGSGPANTLTIRPQAGATGLAITAPTGSVLSLSGATHVIVDGRPGGTGTARELALTCASFSTVVAFSAAASHDTLRSLVLQGRSTSTTGGVITFGFAGATQGNNDNLIESCRITAGASVPTNLVYSAGTTTSPVYYNTRNTLRDCELSDWFSGTNNSVAVLLGPGNRSWTVRGNSVFQTAPRVISTSARVLMALSASMDSLTVEDNWIGGSAPQCAGTPLTLTGNGSITLVNLVTDTLTAASVRRNVIRNLSAAVTAGSSPRLMNLSGRMDVTDNVLGDSASAADITLSGVGGQFTGLSFSANDTSRVTGNSVGGITVTGTSASVTGIQVSPSNAASLEVRDNLVGSETVPNSLLSSGTGSFTGLHFATSSNLPVVLTGNRVANLAHTATSSNNILIGIQVSTRSCTVNDNRVHDLTSTAVSTGGLGAYSLIGIQQSGASITELRFERNTIHSLSSTAATSPVHIAGITFNFASADVVVDRNLLHSFSAASADTGAMLTGLYVYSGAGIPAATFSNNMIRLGIDAAGGHATQGGKVQGIFCQGAHTYVGNTIVVGGAAGGAPSSRTYAFYVWDAGTAPTLRNNILVNTRGQVTLNGRHYALFMTAAGAAGTSSDFNLFHAPGMTGWVAGTNSVGYTSLALWAGTGRDLNSVSGDPLLVDADGPAASVDLHIDAAANPPSPVSGAGTTFVGWNLDYDGTLRDGTAPDIGADEYAELLAVEDGGTPAHTFLSQARPNPVRGGCALEFGLARAGHAALELFDVRGRRVHTLRAGLHEAGRHAVRWDGRAADGRLLAPGTYFLRLTTEGVREVRRLVVLR